MANDPEVAVQLPTRLWQIIDGTIGSTVSVAAESGDESLVRVGTRIREAGWYQVTGWTTDNPVSRGWPPDAELVTVTLSRTLWNVVLAQLDRWNAVAAEVGQEEVVRLGGAARQMVHENLS
jgi:hypothetical protein